MFIGSVPTLRLRNAVWETPEVGRNKPVRALSAGQVFPALQCAEMPETPTLANAGRAYLCPVGIPAYFAVVW
jgi:hypothetical protein